MIQSAFTKIQFSAESYFVSQLITLYYDYKAFSPVLRNAMSNTVTFANDLDRAANLEASFGEIRAMLQPSENALAVLPHL